MTRSPTSVSISIVMLAAILSGPFLEPDRAQAQKRSKPTSNRGSAQSPKTSSVYSCVMHPEVKKGKPGRCPKCGMDLRLTTPESTSTTPVATGADAHTPVSSRLTIPDVELLDQDGRKVRFYTDLVRDRLVAINFIFTTCTTICPPLGATFARVQKELGERAGRDVSFVSISVDPVTDTPERLKAWGAKFNAGPGWMFVTGNKPQVSELLRAFGAASATPQDHSPTILIVDDARGQWTRTYGLAPPSQLVKLINDAISGKLDVKEAAKQ